MRPIFAAALALALAACGGPLVPPSPGPNPNPIQSLAAFTLADLQAASADAHAQNPPDQTAYQCYDFLIAVIPTIQIPGGNKNVGAVLLFQQGRDLANGVTAANGALKNLNLACAPLVIDTQTTLNKLLLLGAGAAATGGAVAPIVGPLIP